MTKEIILLCFVFVLHTANGYYCEVGETEESFGDLMVPMNYCYNFTDMEDVLYDLNLRNAVAVEIKNIDLRADFLFNDNTKYHTRANEIKWISLHGRKLDVLIGDYGFYNYKTLIYLFLNNLNIMSIKKTWFYPNNTIAYLEMNNNRIKRLRKNNFVHLKQLLSIDLSHNFINYTDNNLFAKMHRLNNIVLSYNLLKTIKLRSSTVLYLHLDNNLLTEIDEDQFAHMPKLRELNLEKNQIEYIHNDAFNQNYNLSTINLSYNKLKILNIDLLNNILRNSYWKHHLLFNHNEIALINTNNTDLTTIKYYSSLILELSHNLLTEIEPELMTIFYNITTITLSHNKITSIKPKTFLNKDLMTIYLDNNLITNISENVFNVNVYTLMLNNNLLDVLDWRLFCYITYLYELDVSANRIKNIIFPEDVERTYLNTLNLADNFLSDLDSNLFLFNRKLYELNLSNNSFKYMHKESFANATQLKKLYLTDNKINMTDFDIYYNIPLVDDVDLSGNNIDALPLHFFQMLPDKIKYIDLRNNLLTYFPPLDDKKNITSLFLSKNPWQCKCLDEIINKLNKKSINHDIDENYKIKMNGTTTYQYDKNVCINYDNDCSKNALFVKKNEIVRKFFEQ